IECLRGYLARVLDDVLPTHDGLGATWRLAASLTGLSGLQMRLLLEGLNHLIRSTNLTRKIDPSRLSARAREAIALCDPRRDWDRINRIVLDDLFQRELALKPNPSPPRIALYESHNRIEFYTWDQNDCCLPEDATRATLRDRWLLPGEPGYDEGRQSSPSSG